MTKTLDKRYKKTFTKKRKKHRLVKKEQYRLVISRGVLFVGECLRFNVLIPNPTGKDAELEGKIGITAPKKNSNTKNSVKRNRFRRVVFEAYRAICKICPEILSFSINVSPKNVTLSNFGMKDAEKDFLQLMEKFS